MIVQSTLLFLIALVLLFAGRSGGIPGVVGAAGLVSVVLLLVRMRLAMSIASLSSASEPSLSSSEFPPCITTSCVASNDEGFTGGITGLVRPRLNVLPEHWYHKLGPEGFSYAKARRSVIAQSGAWRRGRIVAVLFTLIGGSISAWIVGPESLMRATGVVELSLVFTVWSFLGLLVLPTLSRLGVTQIDRLLRSQGFEQDLIEETMRRLDDLQDAERSRTSFVEAIFHPIPSVQNRTDGPRTHSSRGYWDVARSSVYLSVSGVGLLGRAVHCNCGRPSLWVFLPCD